MSEEVYKAIARCSSGFVESPAGCGKTEAIVRTVAAYCNEPQLVLTHTHAGVDALRQRFRQHDCPPTKYHVDTIAGWSWGWVRRYASNSGYRGSLGIAEWNDVYAAMSNLLHKAFVKQGILNSYGGVIVDEYQDCTAPMHQLIVDLKSLLPCRILGDDLQGIFGFRNDVLIGWSDVKGEFANDLGALTTPHRWIKVDNEPLGRWLLSARSVLRQNREPDYHGSPIESRTIQYRQLGSELVRLTYAKQGKICVIGPKARPLSAGIETTLVNLNYRILEPNELSALQKLILALSDGSLQEKAEASINFLTRAHGGLSVDDKSFLRNILDGGNRHPRRVDRRALVEKHPTGITAHLLFDLLEYIEQRDAGFCKLRDSVSALKCVLEQHLDSGIELKTLYADEIAKRKHQSRSNIYRCTGSTLLVKGLEFEHVVIIRDAGWQTNWGGYKDLYVALTRGSKSTTLLGIAPSP